MNKTWMINTRGNPLESLHQFIGDVWQAAELDYVYLPLKIPEEPYIEASLIDDPVQLADFNPFTPVMPENLAKKLPGILAEHPDARIGAFLRPCEMRALHRMSGISPVDTSTMLSAGTSTSLGADMGNLVTFCADCLGTFPLDEYEWRAQRKGSRTELSEEAIQFSRQGGIVPYRYRSACQSCENPMADRAEINIGVIGLPIRKQITVSLTNGLGETIDFRAITSGTASKEVTSQRDEVIQRMVHRSKVFRQRVTHALSDVFPETIDELVDHFYECGDCTDCMDNCPICQMHTPQKGDNGRYMSDELTDWVLACVGCGMCEQACEQHIALHLIFSRVREELKKPI